MTYNINALLPIADEIIAMGARTDTVKVHLAAELFTEKYPAISPAPTREEWMKAFGEVEREVGQNDLPNIC